MINKNEIEQNQLDDVLLKVSIAQVFLGEQINVWVEGEENPDLANEIAQGGDIDSVLIQIKNKFPYTIAHWFKVEDKDGSAYFLIPKYFGHCDDKQYVLRKCHRCDTWFVKTTICNSSEPWNCAHGSVLYCANCGAGVDVEGAVHGAHGAELTQEEVERLLKFFKEGDE